VATAEAIGNDVVIVESVRTRTSGPSAVELGARLPAHATAAGKVIMAYAGPLPDRLAESLVALTARTITEMPVLVAQLAGIRRDGVAVERGELEVGRSSVAAPLLNRHGRVLGALMVSGPDTRFHPEAVGVAVTAVARTLTRIGAGANIEFYARLHPHRSGVNRSGPARPDGARSAAPLSPGVR
jgi:DNA-binding IclR family transcriptional regulator